MLDQGWAEKFGAEWIEAWNSHDLRRILSHYADDFEMRSPYIATITGELDGSLRGKAAVESYWRRALARFPDLRFELRDVFPGADSVVIRYRAVDSREAAEFLQFDEAGRVIRASAHYAIEPK
jgi:ketosteroid isomerase-like protein